MNKPTNTIKGLGEVSIRVKDLEAMQKFYEEVLGLEVLRRDESFVFFKIAEGYGGHTQILGLFAESLPPDHQSLAFTGLDASKTSLHHIAFAIGLADFSTEKERLEKNGLIVETQEHGWIHWRSLYLPDPEGNLVELVCFDASVK